MRSGFLKIVFAVLTLVVSVLPLDVRAARIGFAARAVQALENQVYRQFNRDVLIDHITAVETFKTWATQVPDTLKLYVVVQWTEQGLLQQAVQMLDLTDPKVNPDLWSFYRATLFLQLGSVTEAEPFVRKLEESHSRDVDYLFLKSSLYAQKQDYTTAIEILGQILRRSPRFGKAHLQRGLLYLLSMSYDLALEDLQRATKFLPARENKYRQMAFLQIGLIHMKVNLNETEAQKYIKKGVKIDPDSILVQEFYTKIQ